MYFLLTSKNICYSYLYENYYKTYFTLSLNKYVNYKFILIFK